MENFHTTEATELELGDKFTYTFNVEDINSTLDASLPPASVAQLRLYDIFIPLLGVFIISLNLLIVISSGLVLRKGEFKYILWIFFGFL
jgi:hypothetical protein